MTTTQHTLEPWEYTATASLGPQYAIRPEADGPHICIVYQNGNGEANAARIVACVNFLAGIPNGKLNADNATKVKILLA